MTTKVHSSQTPLLSELTTIEIGGSARDVIRLNSEEEIIDEITNLDDDQHRVFILGGGSNILLPDASVSSDIPEFAATVVKVETQGIKVLPTDDGEKVLVEVAAGHQWDDFVAETVRNGWGGLEALSGIPGTCGAAPVQNIGAYGSEVKDVLYQVRLWDRQEQKIVVFSNEDLDFAYRHSMIKDTPYQDDSFSPRYVVLALQFLLQKNAETAPVLYSQLAKALAVDLGEPVAGKVIRDEVLKLRALKGMVLDPKDRDTFSTGSFFKNPIVPTRYVEGKTELLQAPRFPVEEKPADHDGEPEVKLSAAWLIENAGFPKGYGLKNIGDDRGYKATSGRASLSTKHTLAMTNRGEKQSAHTQDILNLKDIIIDGVEEKFGVRLESETQIIQ